MTALQQRLHAIRMERRTLLRKDKLQSWERAAAAWRAKYARQPKWGHRDIANRDADKPRGIEVLRDPSTKQLTSEPQELLRILRGQRQKNGDGAGCRKNGTLLR